MMNKMTASIEKISKKYQKFIVENVISKKEIRINSENLIDFMYFMKNDSDLKYDILCDHTVVDWVNNNSFDLVYNLYSTEYKNYIIISTTIPRNKPIINTVSGIWRIAEWQEREAYDFFGVLYTDHKDLRRLFLEDDWIGFPLRKDYKDNFMLEM
jgi:NADH-quinone oxidoreductase subunit C